MKKINIAGIMMAAMFVLPMAALASGGPVPQVSAVPEPGTILAGAACLLPLAAGAVRAFRKSRK